MSGLVGLLLASNALAQQPTQAQLLVPPDPQLEVMIKAALIALNHANLTGNYGVLRDLAAPSFREANTASVLAEIFAKLRKGKFDFGPIVLLPPRLSRKPWIDERRLLHVQGFFETRPERVNFSLAFSAVGSQWRLFAIGVTTSKPEPPAPARMEEPKQ